MDKNIQISQYSNPSNPPVWPRCAEQILHVRCVPKTRGTFPCQSETVAVDTWNNDFHPCSRRKYDSGKCLRFESRHACSFAQNQRGSDCNRRTKPARFAQYDLAGKR